MSYIKELFNIKAYLLLLITLFVYNPVFSSEANEEHSSKKEFNAGEMIMEHIADAHDWHLFSIGEKHFTIPLPIILIYDGKLDIFLSSKFHHGHSSYKGYKLETEGDNKGKIVRVTDDGYTVDNEAGKILDFSITKNVFAIFISVILLCLILISVAKKYKKRGINAPKGLQSVLEIIILFVRDDIAVPAIGKEKYNKFMPILLTLFFFIFFSNLLGLVPFFPGGANVTGNISVTLVLALFTFFVTNFSGNRNYWKHIFNAPGVPIFLKIPPLMPVVEIAGMITKPFVLMIRLFANIMAGHIIILGFVGLIFIFGATNPGTGYGVAIGSVIFMIFMSLLELLVAFIQAYVFTLLSALYFGIATEEHHKHKAEHKSNSEITPDKAGNIINQN